jgi:hypothetical protein
MIKKTITIIAMMLIILSASFVQAHKAPPPFNGTVTIGKDTTSPGEQISVPVNVTGFNNIGSITLEIRFNPLLMNFTGVSGGYSGLFTPTPYAVDSTIYLIFSATDLVNFQTFSDGLLLNLNFEYIGPTTYCPLSILNTSEVTQGLTVVYPTYTNGGVYPKMNNTCIATIFSTTATSGTGEVFTAQIKYEGFGSNVGAITQKIKYDTTKLSFIDISATANLDGAIATASNGILTIVWSNTSGANINWPTHLINIQFQYIGNTATTLEFYAGSLITNNATSNIKVSYFNGIITPGPTNATAVLGSYSGIPQGYDFNIPITLANLPYGAVTGVGAVTMSLPYDNSKLAFITDTANIFGATVQNTASAINISWSNASAPDINGIFLRLKFKYLGIGTANISFGPACSFITLADQFVQVAYTNAAITPDTTSRRAIIASVYGYQGCDTVYVPVSFSNMPVNMGAATLVLNYDVSKITYIEVKDNNFGAIVWHTAPNIITISWASGTATDINGEFLKLRFLKIAPNSDPPAVIEFVPGCELADISATIIHTTWVNGNVHGNITLNLTNVLLEGLYNGTTTMRQAQDELGDKWSSGIADHITVELHDATTYATVIYTANDIDLSTTGTATVVIPGIYNGSYYITVKHRNSIETTTATAVLFGTPVVTRSYALAANVFGGNLKLISGHYLIYAGDVNQDGIVDGSDMSFIQNDTNLASSGYLYDDCNGDGLIDGSDMSIAQNNANQAIGIATP